MFIFWTIFMFFSFQVNAENYEKVIEKYILENPETILQSLKNYEEKKDLENKKENKSKINKLKKEIFLNDNNLYSGNRDSQRIIVEFFDYNCSYCKKAHEDIDKLLEKHKDLKVIYKNFPILSEKSVELAKIGLLIARKSNKKFNSFHKTLMKKRKIPTENELRKILKKLDLEFDDIKRNLSDKSLDENLKSDFQLAQKLELRGTPAFIVGEEILFGYVGFEELSSRIID